MQGDVVTRIDDDGQVGLGCGRLQAARETRAADAARQGNDVQPAYGQMTCPSRVTACRNCSAAAASTLVAEFKPPYLSNESWKACH